MKPEVLERSQQLLASYAQAMRLQGLRTSGVASPVLVSAGQDHEQVTV